MGSHSFPRTARIRHRPEFKRLFKEGRRFETAHFFLYSLENGLGHPRLGLTVSRKAGHAVQRNYVKRILREVFRRNARRASLDILVSAKRHAATISYAEAEREFLSFLETTRHETDPHRHSSRL